MFLEKYINGIASFFRDLRLSLHTEYLGLAGGKGWPPGKYSNLDAK